MKGRIYEEAVVARHACTQRSSSVGRYAARALHHTGRFPIRPPGEPMRTVGQATVLRCLGTCSGRTYQKRLSKPAGCNQCRSVQWIQFGPKWGSFPAILHVGGIARIGKDSEPRVSLSGIRVCIRCKHFWSWKMRNYLAFASAAMRCTERAIFHKLLEDIAENRISGRPV